MSGDYSRDSFDALRDFAGVFLQQGRAALDADWNEMVQIFERRIRAGTVDTIGRAVTPRETPQGFEIRRSGDSLEIGRGRMYLDGLLLECHGHANFSGDEDGAPDPVFDRGRREAGRPVGVLDERIAPEAGDFLPYDRQPYWPAPANLPENDGRHLAYVVAWQREVTPVEDPSLLEPALGGIDTATRWQSVWQVRVLENVGAEVTCETPDEGIDGWLERSAPSTARLTTATVEVEDPEDPCLVPPTDGYTGLENQFYRVELHTVGDTQADARFKFSRENASVAAAIERFASPADRVTVRRIGRDDVLRFRPGDWVEITDDRRELQHRSGQMRRVAHVNEQTREIELEGQVDPDLVPAGTAGDTVLTRRSRMIRWSQRGVIRLADGSEWADLDAPNADGLVPVPPDGRAIVLESGVTVSFATAAGPGGFREMDYWRFAARTAGTQIETLSNAPPDGVQRHYGRLAILTASGVRDCREKWPPAFEGGGDGETCGCTVCVTPESHESRRLTIQDAIHRIDEAGGTVCLAGGTYRLVEPLLIAGKTALTLRGQGAATRLTYRGGGAALSIASATDVQVERLSLLVTPPDEDASGTRPTVAGIAVVNAVAPALRRLAVLVASTGTERRDHAVAIDGAVMAAKVEECLLLAPVALGSMSSSRGEEREGPGFVALAEFRAVDNVLVGARAAVRFENRALNVASVRLARNVVFGTDAGLLLTLIEPPSGSTAIADNVVSTRGDAMRLGSADLRVTGNEISGGAELSNGILLVRNSVPETQGDARIEGNRIAGLAGTGIGVEATLASLRITGNLLRSCGFGGIFVGPKASVRQALIESNVIEDIADSAGDRDAAAIVVTRVERGRIAGNGIRGVGRDGEPSATFAGVAVQAVGDIDIEGNSVDEVGPSSAAAPAVAVMARTPYRGLLVRGNRLSGAAEDRQAEGAGWMGVLVRRAGTALRTEPETRFEANVPAQARTPGIDSSEVVFAEASGRAFAVSRTSFAEIGPAGEQQITVVANQIRHAANGRLAMVEIVDPEAGGVIFTENQCRLEAPGEMTALVLIAAERIVAGNNVVRRTSDALAMGLQTGQTGQAVVLGNITFGTIEVQPGGLQPPFAGLNLLGS